jgi:hypothetical protein
MQGHVTYLSDGGFFVLGSLLPIAMRSKLPTSITYLFHAYSHVVPILFCLSPVLVVECINVFDMEHGSDQHLPDRMNVRNKVFSIIYIYDGS